MDNYEPLGMHLRLVDDRNSELVSEQVLGINIDKYFIPSVANVIGTDLSKYKLLSKGLFACNPMHVGRDKRLPVALYSKEDPAIVSPAYFLFEVVDTEVLNPDYLMLWFRRSEFDRLCWLKTDSSVRSGITWDDICRLEVPIIPIEKQLHIVRNYSIIAERIELKKRLNDYLEEQVSVLYCQMFEASPSKKWENGTLSDIAIVASGKRPPMKSSTVTDEAIFPIVGAASIMGFTSAANHNDKILVIGRVGTHGIVQRFNSPCWTSDNTLVITSDYYEYLYQILKRIDYSSLNRGSTQPLITQGDINKMPILIPDKGTLSKYEKLAGTIMSKYEINMRESQLLAQIRDTLLPRLMSGKHDVSNLDL